MTWDPTTVTRDHLGQPTRHTAHTVSEWLGYLSHTEIEVLQRLAQSLPRSPVVVNIGAGGGTSGLALLEARPDLYLVTIDVQKEASPYGSLAGEETVLRHAGVWGIRNEQIHKRAIIPTMSPGPPVRWQAGRSVGNDATRTGRPRRA